MIKRRLWSKRALWPMALLLLALFSTTPADADGPNRAALILQFGNGQTETRCVQFAEAEISGAELLRRAGVDPLVDPNGGAVCRIREQGCNFPEQACFCQCQGSTCTYWSYWRLTGNVWQYSTKGAAISAVHNGDVDGWAWGAGTITSAVPPPVASFEDICAVVTDTPSPTLPPPTDAAVTATTTRRPAATRAWRLHTSVPSATPTPTVEAQTPKQLIFRPRTRRPRAKRAARPKHPPQRAPLLKPARSHPGKCPGP